MIYYTEMLDIDIKQLQHDCIELNKKIENDIIGPQDLRKYSKHPSMCTAAAPYYNLFTYTKKSIFNLQKKIRKSFYEKLGDDKYDYWIQGWLNYWPKAGDTLGWHAHQNDHIENCWHGVVGVNCNDTFAEYRTQKTKDLCGRVENWNGQLLISQSWDMQHRISDWKNKKEPRITIAFNIQPIETLHDDIWIGKKEIDRSWNYYIAL